MHLSTTLLFQTLLALTTTALPNSLSKRDGCPPSSPPTGSCSSAPADYGQSCVTDGYSYHTSQLDNPNLPTVTCAWTREHMLSVLEGAITDAQSAYHCPTDGIVQNYVFPATPDPNNPVTLKVNPANDGEINYQDLAAMLAWFATAVSQTPADRIGKISCFEGSIHQGEDFVNGDSAGYFSLCGSCPDIDRPGGFIGHG